MKQQHALETTSLAALVFMFVLIVAAPTLAQFELPGEFGDADVQYVTLRPLFSRASLAPGDTCDAALMVIVSPEWHINSARPHQDWLIPARLYSDTIPGLTPYGISYPLGSDVMLIGEKMSVYHDSIVIHFKVTAADSLAPGEYRVPLRFDYQPCNDKECRAPQSDTTALTLSVGERGELINASIFAHGLGAERQESAPPVATEEENALQRLINERGFWGYLIAFGLAFLTGLLLSFSPCTYPMIPITVSVFAGQERSLGRGFLLSLLYVGSMAAVYGIMGLIVSLVGGVFGAWLASTPVVIGIAVVFVIFALSMFGLYELQVPSAMRQKLGTKATGGGIIGSIVLGIIAALVVSPCVGPFVAGILLYIATTGSPVIGFFVLFIFALGLGTLYVIIATFSSAINKLPGAGAWMESVKRFFGVVLLLMAIYFLRTILPTEVTALVTSLLLIAFGVFGGGLDRLTPEAGFFLRLKKLLGILALLVGTYLFLGTLLTQGLLLPPASNWLPSQGTVSTETDASLIDWETDLESGLQQAKAQGKPVLIDTWATWCVNCRVLDKKTFGNPEVAAEAKRFLPLRIQLETAGSPITKEFMSRFGMSHYSLPTTLLLDSDGQTQRVLRGVVGPEDMIAEMRKVR